MPRTTSSLSTGFRKPVRKPAQLNRIKIEDLIAEWQKLCDFEKDAHVAISSDEGDGKSTLLTQIVKICKGKLSENIVYTPNVKEFYYKYEQMEETKPLGFDEALDLINRLDWHKAEVKDLVKHIRGKVRKEKRAIFVYNVQLFRDLHSYWRNHRIRWWLELTPREWYGKEVNYVYTMQRSRVPFITGKRDAWLLDENEKSWLGYMSSGKIMPEHYLNMLRSHPFYVGEFKFRNDTDLVAKYKQERLKAFDEWKIPEEQKVSKKILKLQETIDKQNKLMYERGITQPDIAAALGKAPNTISASVNRV